MFKAIKSKRGEAYIDVCIAVVCIMMVIVLALNTFSFLTLKMNMDYFAREMITVATVNGYTYKKTENRVAARYEELKKELGVSPSIDWTGTNWFSTDHGMDKVQYGNTICITLTLDTEFAGFGIFSMPITLKASYSGLSRQYHKT